MKNKIRVNTDTQQEYIEVPVKWLERLKEIAEGMTGVHPNTAMLTGYISSVDTILKYNKRITK